ncbi:hypothetical protein GGTG_10978 [Gaeumannomyces tritici R3-111a-1]|uniref:Uncharacterized protein n=1 Tax=Gaeumannomyces tritici (strain R3-111a-1) TaxID=644352 RepID=J3PBV6_GAET3|nr:hypothetical protein GGTG_10978 [Gaeumannomyces tritici R3-111a-1]EJT71724.1 hypothetical protein GGTG_10978 [Gaeumannomyces tritici R3-111a-1]
MRDLAFEGGGKPLEDGKDALSLTVHFYSFGVDYSGTITNYNYPSFLRDFTDPDGVRRDLGTIGILRNRERGVPRYCEFRHLSVPRAFLDITGPQNKEQADRLSEAYGGDVTKVDAVMLKEAESAEESRRGGRDHIEGFLWAGRSARPIPVLAVRSMGRLIASVGPADPAPDSRMGLPHLWEPEAIPRWPGYLHNYTMRSQEGTRCLSGYIKTRSEERQRESKRAGHSSQAAAAPETNLLAPLSQTYQDFPSKTSAMHQAWLSVAAVLSSFATAAPTSGTGLGTTIPRAPAAPFSFAQWVEDIIATPEKALTPEQAVEAWNATVATMDPRGLEKRVICNNVAGTEASVNFPSAVNRKLTTDVTATVACRVPT